MASYENVQKEIEDLQHGINFKNETLFTIPNPFGLSISKKKAWFSEVKRLEKLAGSTRLKLSEFAVLNNNLQKELTTVRAYCDQIKNRRSTHQ